MSPRGDHSPAGFSAVRSRVSSRYSPPAGMFSNTAFQVPSSSVGTACQSRPAATAAPVSSRTRRTSTCPAVSNFHLPCKLDPPLPPPVLLQDLPVRRPPLDYGTDLIFHSLPSRKDRLLIGDRPLTRPAAP